MNNILSCLEGVRTVIIAGHTRPDGDCVGACMGLWHYLRDNYPEIEADVILMAKKGTDGIYDSDPNKNSDAHKFDKLAYKEILNRGLQVMDSTATSLCMDNKIPLVVFNIDDHENILRAALGEEIGTTVNADN